MSWLTPRKWFLLAFVAAAALLAIGYFYFQIYMQLYPCPLCIFQRFAFIGIALFGLLGAVHNPGRAGQIVYGLLLTLSAGFGIVVAGRHLWLQSLPAELVPACGPGLDYIMENFPFLRALDMIFTGSGSCAEVSWRFLGLTMPWWTLLWYAGFAVLTLWVVFSRRAAKQRMTE